MQTIGFGFKKENGLFIVPYQRNEHKFKTVIGKDCEIGSNVVIDRGSWRDTVIGDGTKIDSGVKVAHNARIGKNCLLVHGCIICGSAEIGDNCFIGANAVIKPHIKVTNNVTLDSLTNVGKDIIEPHTTWANNPARKIHNYQAHYDLPVEKRKVIGGKVDYVGW